MSRPINKFVAAGWLIGSGIVESTNKLVVVAQGWRDALGRRQHQSAPVLDPCFAKE